MGAALTAVKARLRVKSITENCDSKYERLPEISHAQN
jgi:hypothetical protein